MTGTPGLRLRSATEKPDFDAVRALCWAFRDTVADISADDRAMIDTIYPKETYSALMDSLETAHAPPLGAVILAELDGRPIGCGMTQALAPGISELKRLYVSPEGRGSGAGRAICETLMETARKSGFHTMRLDTSKSLKPAQALYQALGFIERGPYADLPDIAKDRLLFFERRL